LLAVLQVGQQITQAVEVLVDFAQQLRQQVAVGF
jgi:hypothetical protein